MNRKQVEQCLRSAAEVIDDGIEMFVCNALSRCTIRGVRRDASCVMDEWFWPQLGDDWGYRDNDEGRASRVIGLLLAAEIVETEGAP